VTTFVKEFSVNDDDHASVSVSVFVYLML